jgi:Leucine-rich repeat (LRR) protein
LEKL